MNTAPTLSAAAAGIRSLAGPGFDIVASWEGKVREIRSTLEDHCWPGTPLNQQAARVRREADRLVEGTTSALHRAVQFQPVPWVLGENPLAAFATRASAFRAAAAEVLEISRRITEVAERYDALHARFVRFPRAWARWSATLDLDPQEIFDSATGDELDGIDLRLRRMETELERWRAEIAAWLAETGGDADLSLDVSEARYLSLLELGCVDRASGITRATGQIRLATRVQIEALPHSGEPDWPGMVRDLALQWTRAPAEMLIGAEEAACYRAVLRDGYAARRELPNA